MAKTVFFFSPGTGCISVFRFPELQHQQKCILLVHGLKLLFCPQSWLDKRGLGQPSYGGFGRPLGDAYRYFNWKDYLAAGISKRQLNYGPRSFGNFQRYFTNGLQDWRSTYTGGMKKREAPKEPEPSA